MALSVSLHIFYTHEFQHKALHLIESARSWEVTSKQYMLQKGVQVSTPENLPAHPSLGQCCREAVHISILKGQGSNTLAKNLSPAPRSLLNEFQQSLSIRVALMCFYVSQQGKDRIISKGSQRPLNNRFLNNTMIKQI